MTSTLTALASLPALEWTGREGHSRVSEDGSELTLIAEAGVDWSNDALGADGQLEASALVFDAPQSFSLSARVRVEGVRTTFDAGALVIWNDDNHWAKLCFEYSPQGQAMVVSVVTNTYSDDCNSTLVLDDTVFLRVSRVADAWAFHWSSDGVYWNFVRLFRLDSTATARVGFLSQAPMGDTCEAIFDRIVLASRAPAELRDGS